jgi:hypothetical protein
MSTPTGTASTAPASRTIVGNRTMELVVGLVLLVVGVGLAISNWKIGARWAADGPQSGYFPFYLSVLLAACATYGIFDVLRTHRATGAADTPFVDQASLVRVLQVLVPTILFCLATEFLGIYIAGFLLIAGFMRWIGKTRWWNAILTALIMAAALFFLFEIQFQVPMPKGPVEDLLGY